MKYTSFKITLVFLIYFIATGCNSSSKFDRQKWSYGDGLDYPLRDDIINDLVQNHHIKGLTYRQVIDSLGAPQKRDTLQVSYQILDNSYIYIRKKPIRKKSLVLYFSKDSVVTRFEVYDHTNKK